MHKHYQKVFKQFQNIAKIFTIYYKLVKSTLRYDIDTVVLHWIGIWDGPISDFMDTSKQYQLIGIDMPYIGIGLKIIKYRLI